MPGLSVICRDEVSEIEAVMYNPVICLILRGRKQVGIGEHSVSLTPGDAFLVSHDLPVSSKITQAAVDAPYLALIFTLDLGIIRSFFNEVGEALPEIDSARSFSDSKIDEKWAEPMQRYLDLMDKPLEAQVIGPLILKEIHFQLLLSPIGSMLRSLSSVDSNASRIAEAIMHIKKCFREALVVADLAKLSAMSPSTFHEHFKSVTGTTPLQYQKDLRLIEAQFLLREGRRGVSVIGHEVGYESPTHFSRDYTRKFGCSPKHHLGMGS